MFPYARGNLQISVPATKLIDIPAGLPNNEDLHTLELMACGYTAISFPKGYGLWRNHAWAEWLAAVSGAICLPIEISHLIKHVSLTNIRVLMTDVALVAYMIIVCGGDVSKP